MNMSKMSASPAPLRNHRKIVFIGASDAGKTSIIHCFVKNSAGETQPTIGTAFYSREVETPLGPVQLSVWDTAGMERYKSLVPKYSRGASAAVVVFDVADRLSYLAAQSFLEEAISNGGEGFIPFLVGNKIDLAWAIEESEALEFAIAHNAEFMSVSAKTGDKVGDLFETIAMRVRQVVPPSDSELGPLHEPPAPRTETNGCC
jgi:small GTP-binding protein